MKKLFMTLLMAMLVAALAACSGDEKKDEEQATDSTVTEGTSDEDVAVESTGNEYYDNVVAILKDAGYEVTNVTDGDPEFFTDTKNAFSAEINGEDMLTLQLFEIDPDSEYLKNAKETGMGQAEFEGEVAEIPVDVIGNHYIFLAEGHPDQEDVIKLLKEKLQ